MKQSITTAGQAFNIFVAKLFWESKLDENIGGHFNIDLYLRILEVRYRA